jgi:hypothetical protein
MQGPHALDGYIQNYDCPYHIILTNVKTKPQIASPGKEGGPLAGPGDGVLEDPWRAERMLGQRHRRHSSSRPGPRHPRLAGYEDYPARDLAVPQLLQDFVDLRQWPGGGLAAKFTRGAQGQDLF